MPCAVESDKTDMVGHVRDNLDDMYHVYFYSCMLSSKGLEAAMVCVHREVFMYVHASQKLV